MGFKQSKVISFNLTYKSSSKVYKPKDPSFVEIVVGTLPCSYVFFKIELKFEPRVLPRGE